MKQTGIDYQQIVENLKIEQVKQMLESFGCDVIDKGDHLITNTICHHAQPDDGSYKLYYYDNNHLFYCYTSCGPMSIFSLLQHIYEAKEIDYNWYRDILEVAQNCSTFKINDSFERNTTYQRVSHKYKKEVLNELPTFSDGILDIFDYHVPIEWQQEGITLDTIDKFNIKYSIPQNKIIIPHYNLQDKIIGIRGRALNEWEIENVGKYMPVQIEGKFYSHPLSLNLYGLNKTKQHIKKTHICYLFESEKSVLKMDSFNMVNCSAAVCGSNFNKFQLKILLKACKPQEIVLCFDKEEKIGEDKYFNKLYNICNKYKKYTNMSFVYDRENLLDMKDAPVDKGEEVFRELLRNRVKVK